MTKRTRKRSRRKAPPKPRTARSLHALGKALGVSHTAVKKWTEHPLWPWNQNGPFVVAAVQRWRDEVLQEDRSAVERPELDPADRQRERSGHLLLGRIRMARQIEQTKKTRLEREILEGKRVPKRESDEDFQRRLLACRAVLLDTPRRIEAALDWLPEADRRRIGKAYDRAIRQSLEMLAGRRKAFDLPTPPAEKPA